MRTSLWLACAIALSVCFAAPVLAQGNGNGGGSGNGGGNGGGGPPPDAGPPPAPAPAPAPPPEPAPAPAPEPAQNGATQGEGNGGNAGSAPGHDPAGPGNSENAPGHDPHGPGNSELAHAEKPAAEEPASPSAGGNGTSAGGANRTGTESRSHDGGKPHAEPRATASAPGKGEGSEAAGKREERGRAQDEPGPRDPPPGRNASRERGPSERALERRAGGEGVDVPGRGQGPAGGGNAAGSGSQGHGLGGGVGASEGEIPAAQLERASVSENAQERVAAVHVRREERDVDVARGDVLVEASGVEDPEHAFLVIIHPNGTEDTLAAGSLAAPWNTTAYENGYYTVEVRERTSSGETATVASARVLVENPRSSAVAVVAAVATGTVVSAGAGLLAARGIDAAGLLKAAAAEASGEAASRAAEEKLRRRTATVASVNWARRSALLLVAAGAMLAFFKVFADRDDILLALPIAFLAAFVYTVTDYGAEWMIARSSGAQTRFRIWAPGAISLAVSSLLFRAPFGYPGYVSETDVGHASQHGVLRQRAGLRALAFMGVGIALTLPFLIVGSLWRWELAEYGIGLALMMGAAGAMPFSPMPGKDVWVWNKLAWACIAGVLLALYLLWQLALLPMGLLVAAGLVGGTAFAMGLRMLRPAKAA